jgi:hypothetical protein
VTRSIRLTIFALLLVMAAVAAAIPSLLPAPAAATPAPTWRGGTLSVRGAYHVHSRRSDGTGSIDEIAAAAARAGLQFVVFTDHGDGTRALEPPRYRAGVLCLDAVELNTASGHLVVVGSRPSTYPLAGRASAVIEDAHRLGGMAFAAHPDSPRPTLQWKDWSAPLDGLEWLNADSEWRDEFLGSLGRYLLTYRLRPAETLTAALDRPATALDRWDQLTPSRRVVGLAGADAHARLGFRQQTDPYEGGWHLKVPSYEASFKTFGIRVQLPVPLKGDAVADAENVLTHLRLGRVYSVIDGLATPGAFEFAATSGDRKADMGGYLDIRGEVVLHVRHAAPEGSRMVILRNGQAFFDTSDREIRLGVVAEPAVYRVEIHVPGATGQPPIPWLVSNPIYVGMRAAHEAVARPAPPVIATRRASIATELWGAEASAMSLSTLRPPTVPDGIAGLEWHYQLASGVPAGQYAAVRFPVDGLVGLDRLQLRARADHAVRIWLQLRASTVGEGERWGRTMYLDQDYRSLEVRFDELEPLGATSTPSPPLDRIDVVLMVVDTVNTLPGTAGVVQIAELWLAAR